MPGLKQLEQFRDELGALGNEISVRAQRGEPLSVTPLPENDGWTPDQSASEDAFADILSGSADDPFSDLPDLPFNDSLPDLPEELNSLDEPGSAGASSADISSDDEVNFDFSSLDSLLNPDVPDESAAVGDDFSIPEDLLSGFAEDMENSPADTALPDDFGSLPDAELNSDPAEAAGDDGIDDFSMPDFDWGSLETPVAESSEAGDLSEDELSVPSEFTESSEFSDDLPSPDQLSSTDFSDTFDLPDTIASSEDMTISGADEAGLSISDQADFAPEEISLNDFDMPDIDIPLPPDDEVAELEELDDEQERNTADGSFDMPDLPDGVLGVLDSEGDPDHGEFNISGFPGLSEESSASGTSNFAAPSGDAVLKKDFTDAEYRTFISNLESYPLNLRIAVEQVVAGGDYKDDVIVGLIRLIIGGPRIRELATRVEKILDKSINIPRDFEKRTAAEYEASKSTLSYKLLNQILPAAIIGVLVCAFTAVCVLLGNRFVYRPLKAESLYKQGYAFLDDGYYSQSIALFNEADSYQSKKNWYFQYARGYRDKRQYIMAEDMYERLLDRFDNDKKAGLEYAGMESQELLNYSKAEDIVKRRVLDNYINDRDGMLLLGDIYMDWAQDKDPSKYEKARQTYATLIQLYGNTDLYLSRMMRYFIRTDNLAEVLPLKAYFFPKKKALEASDLTELSGYLLDKLYAPPGGKDEYLRPYIEDVRALLERAVEAGPTIPEAHYNLARYFMHSDNQAMAKYGFEQALSAFETVPVMTSARVIRNIDSFRLLGELYMAEQEYLKAEELYVNGIRLFETEQNKLPKDERVGMLFADLADIDYFISGDLDQALLNYSKAAAQAYDTPRVRYHSGYIHYQNKAYDKAMNEFIKTIAEVPSDTHALLALGNVLFRRGNAFAAQGYYERLLDQLNSQLSAYAVIIPQVRADQGELVELYMNAANNLGVTLHQQALQTGNSGKNAAALVSLTDSMRAWDALTRNPETMIRLSGSNLAAENLKYITHSSSEYKPEIYAKIPQTLYGEKGLRQAKK